MSVANRVFEILDTIDVSQWKHLTGIDDPGKLGSREIMLQNSRGLKRPENEWPEQAILLFALGEENI